VLSSPLRRALVGALGIALVTYGVASLTGNWLGTPPWWKMWRDGTREKLDRDAVFGNYASAYDAKWRVWIQTFSVFVRDSVDGDADVSDPIDFETFDPNEMRPGAPPRLSTGDFMVPMRWTSGVREGWEWVGWALAEVGLLVTVGAAFAGRRSPRLEPAV
jgi:hypothetical protein